MATEKRLSQETNQITDLTNDVRLYGIEDTAGTPASGWIDPDDIVDATAIHKATAAEISAITLKETLVDDDLVLIEDSEDSNNKKRAKKSSFGTANAKTISKGNTFLPAIVFNYDEKYFNQYTQSGALAITLGSNTNGVASYIYSSIITDSSAITFPAAWIELRNDYIDDNAIYGLTIFYDGVYYQYSFYKIIELENYINWEQITNGTLSNYILTSTSSDCYAIGSEIINKTDGNYVEFIYTNTPDASGVVISLANESTPESWSGSNLNHSIWEFSGKIYTKTDGSSIDSGIAIGDGYLFRLELVDDGAGDYNVLYKYSLNGGTSYATIKTEPLTITGNVYVHCNITVGGNKMTNAVELNN